MLTPGEVRPSVPDDVQDVWRAKGAWTDETLLDRLASASRRFGDDALVIDGDARLSAAELDARSAHVAAALAAEGVGHGDVVAYQLPNWWETVVLAWAVLRCGAVVAPITPTLGPHEVAFVLAQTRARVLAVPAAPFRGVDYTALAEAAGFAGTLITVRDGGSFTSLLAGDGGLGVPEPEVHADDPAVVLYTSGTTSDPKGVVHTHQSMRHEADSLVAAHGLTPGERLLLPMPLTHVAGVTYGILFPVLLGVPVVLMDRWDPGTALRILEVEKVAVMIGTPVFMRTMIDHPSFAGADTSSMRLWSMGGAGVSPDQVLEAASAFGCWCKRTYGSTEYPTLTTSVPEDPPEVSATTDGRAIGFAEWRVSVEGELVVRGPEMFAGYLDPASGAEAWLDGGWFRTGDLAAEIVGDDGVRRLRIVGRLKDIIIRGGENISAQEVEDHVHEHAAVADVAVVGYAERVMGERVCAFLVLRDGASLDLEDLGAFLTGRGLARFKHPERIEITDVLPRTASGKVRKHKLRSQIEPTSAA